MSRRELGSLVLVSFLLVGGFYYAKFSYSNAPDSRALLAQTSTGASGSSAPASSATRVDGTCISGQSIVLNVGSGGVKAVQPVACDPEAANTCKVTVNAPNIKPVVVDYCCRPSDGVCYCKTTPTCPAITQAQKLSGVKAKCAQNNTPPKSSPGVMVRPESQLAQAEGIIPCNSGKASNLIKEYSSSAVQPNANTGSPAAATPANTNTASPASKTPVATAPTAPQNDFRTGLQNPTDTTGRQTGQSAVQSNNQTYSQIQAEGAKGGTGSGQTTFPSQPQQTQPTGPAFEQGGVYRPGYTNPSGGLAGGTRPGYFSPSRAQTTFGGTGFSGARSSGRAAGSFISGIASLIGGLFSVPTNNVVNYVQSFVGGSSQQQQTPPNNPNNNQNGAQQQTYAPGQVIVVVPYPMPTSRKGDALAQLPPPPTSTTDAYAELREMARQADGTTGAATPTGAQDDRITSAFSGQDEQTRQGTTPTGNANSNSRGGSAAGQGGGLLGNGLQMGTTSVPEGKATSTHATSTSYKEPRVVEVGIPVDITDLGSYEAVLAYLRGDWARTEHTALQNKVALAQAEVQQEAIRAQIEALQDARAADLCDDSCATSLTVLQNELPVLQSRVEALQTAVEKDAQPRPSSPPPTVAQIHRVVESLAEPTYKASVPRSAAGEPTAVSVSGQEALPEVPQTKSEKIVTRVVQSIWNFLKSIFLPPATEAAKPRPSCSLFSSLFGKCK